MSNYGIGYKGSKNKIADKIIELFPDKKHLYDLFAGGCSITHAALLSRKFNYIFCNDINAGIINLFRDAIRGKYHKERRWISREDFFKYKETDAYINYIWSFGNKGDTYLYGEDVEPYKKALHYAIVFDDVTLLQNYFIDADFSFLDSIKGVNKRRLALQRYFKQSGAASGSPLESSADCESLLQSLTRLQSLERLESLERLVSLERLQNLEAVNYTNLSYDEVTILNDSVIYCDIPYKNTDGYNGEEFDFDKFYTWAANQKEILFISSYEMPESDFITIAEIPHVCTLSHNNHYAVNEKVFIPRHQLNLYQKLRPQKMLFDDLLY